MKPDWLCKKQLPQRIQFPTVCRTERYHVVGWTRRVLGGAGREGTSAGQGREEAVKAARSRAPQHAPRGIRLFPVNGMQVLGSGNRDQKHRQGGWMEVGVGGSCHQGVRWERVMGVCYEGSRCHAKVHLLCGWWGAF